MKDRVYVINLDDKQCKRTLSFIHWHKYGCVLWFFCEWIYSTRSIKQNQRQIMHNMFFFLYQTGLHIFTYNKITLKN